MDLRKLSRVTGALLLALLFAGRSVAQHTRPPLDIMLLIDNSCSMYTLEEARRFDCRTGAGTDPDYLRLTGAEIFLAALGFDEANETDYQIGIISFGGEAELVSPLQPLTPFLRGELARQIQDPEAIFYTAIAPALELAYDQLLSSPSRQAGNIPAVVLITDGKPEVAGQTAPQLNARIEQLVAGRPEIPVFVILVQGQEDASAAVGFQEYISFWQSLQGRYDHVFTDSIAAAEEIEDTYNAIVSQLQNTTSTESFLVDEDSPLEFFVNRYVQRVDIRAIHSRSSGEPRGTVTVTDPRGNVVTERDRGVSRFNDPNNSVEQLAIGADRLNHDDNGDGVYDLKDDFWTVASDVPVSVYVDMRDAFNFNFMEPSVSVATSGLSSFYVVTAPHAPDESFRVRFSLLDVSGQTVLEPQPIRGRVIHPDGSEAPLLLPLNLQPDAGGVYEISHDFLSTFPGALEGFQKFRIELEAGTFAVRSGLFPDRVTSETPIAAATLVVDVGQGSFIRSLQPATLLCTPGSPAELAVEIGDEDPGDVTTLSVRVTTQDGEESLLRRAEPGRFTAQLQDLCRPLAAALSCSATVSQIWTVRLLGTTGSGIPLRDEMNLPVEIAAATCTPTPAPTSTATPVPTATPTPTPTPIPDTDGDGGNDIVDACLDQAGWPFLDWCPVPWYGWLMLGLLTTGIIIATRFFFWPLLAVHTFAKPPAVYLLVCRGDRPDRPLLNLAERGRSRRHSQVTIGSSDAATVKVAGVAPFEVLVKREGTGQAAIYRADKSGKEGSRIRTLPQGTFAEVRAADNVRLKFALEQADLRC